MAVVSIFKVTGPGDPDEVFKIQDEKVAPAARDYAQANGASPTSRPRPTTGCS
jgi:hypothetical protein